MVGCDDDGDDHPAALAADPDRRYRDRCRGRDDRGRRRGPGLCAREPVLRLGCRGHRRAPVRGGVVDADQGGHPGAGRGRVRHLPVDRLALGAGAVGGGGGGTGAAPPGGTAWLHTHPPGARRAVGERVAVREASARRALSDTDTETDTETDTDTETETETETETDDPT